MLHITDTDRSLPSRTPAHGCFLCAVEVRLSQCLPLAQFNALVGPYAQERCRCPGRPHRLLVQHPHVPAACTEGFTLVPTREE